MYYIFKKEIDMSKNIYKQTLQNLKTQHMYTLDTFLQIVICY